MPETVPTLPLPSPAEEAWARTMREADADLAVWRALRAPRRVGGIQTKAAAWEEEKHPRGAHGHFTAVPHEIATHPAYQAALASAHQTVATMGHDEMEQMHHMVGDYLAGHPFERGMAAPEHGQYAEDHAMLRAVEERAYGMGQRFTADHRLVPRGPEGDRAPVAYEGHAAGPTERALAAGAFSGPMTLMDGKSLNAVYHAVVSDGGKDYRVVVKPESGLGSGPGGDPGELAHERAAYLINEAMGRLVDVPATVIRDTPYGRGMVQHYVDGSHTLAAERPASTPASRKEMGDISFFDGIIANLDRHNGNVLVTGTAFEPHLHAIDHGLGFTGTTALNVDRVEPHQREAAARLSDALPRLADELRAAGLTHAELQDLAVRIARVRDEPLP